MQVTSPAISIVMPTLNQAGFLKQAIDSVLSQSSAIPTELFVVDGGSDDGTIEILKSYGPALSWISESDRGQSEAVNKGLSRVRGEIVGWLNSDDLYQPGAFQAVAEAFHNPAIQWIYGKADIVNQHGLPARSLATSAKNAALPRLTFGRLLEANWISQMSVFWRRNFQAAAGPFREDLHLAMDYDMWLRFWKQLPGTFVNRTLASFRVHDNSKSGRHVSAQLRESMLIARQHAGNRDRLHLHRRQFYAFLIRIAYRIL